MKHLSLLLCTLLFSGLILFTPVTAADDDIVPGDDMTTVLERLGAPKGSIGSDRFQILYFDRGEVHVRDGVVEAADLVTEEEVVRRKEVREARQRAIELRRQQRIEEGNRLLEARLSDPNFANASPEQRLVFFDTFQNNYPEVDVSSQRRVALSHLEASQQQRRFAEARLAREKEQVALEIWRSEMAANAAEARRKAAARQQQAQEKMSISRAQQELIARLAARPGNNNPLFPNQSPSQGSDPDETPQAKPLPPGIDAVYSRGGVNIHYRSDYTTNRTYIQRP